MLTMLVVTVIFGHRAFLDGDHRTAHIVLTRLVWSWFGLSKFFDNSPGFWVNLQLRYGLYEAREDEKDEIEKIPTLDAGQAPAMILAFP